MRWAVTPIALCASLVFSGTAQAQSFSCSFGKQPSCLDYGDTVCSSMGKCVDDDAVCFQRYQCDYDGFTCKSNVNECNKKLGNLAGEYDDLVDRYNQMVTKHDEVVRKHNDLLIELEDVRGMVRKMKRRSEDFRYCVMASETMEEVEGCHF